MANYTVVTDGTRRNRTFEALCAKSQKVMKKYLRRKLRKLGREVIYDDGYIYSPGSVPIILTAHMDTVHEELPKEMIYKSGTISSPQGIGGDDRCGIYMILELIKTHDCHILFFEDEEIGGLGSDKFIETEICKNLAGKINYAIELDRKGKNDAVYYRCDNYDFEDFVEEKFWKYSYGSFSDICNICPAIKCAGVNLSCGYYNAHTLIEYVVLSEMERAIGQVSKLIERSTDTQFEYIERKRCCNVYGKYSDWYDDDSYIYSSYYNYKKGVSTTNGSSNISTVGTPTKYANYTEYEYSDSDIFNDPYTENEYEISWSDDRGEHIENVSGRSEQEAIGAFMMMHTEVCYDDIVYMISI